MLRNASDDRSKILSEKSLIVTLVPYIMYKLTCANRRVLPINQHAIEFSTSNNITDLLFNNSIISFKSFLPQISCGKELTIEYNSVIYNITVTETVHANGKEHPEYLICLNNVTEFKVNRFKSSQLLYNTAINDLKNPLNVIKGIFTIMSIQPTLSKKCMEIGKRTTKILEYLIEDSIEIIKIEKGSFKMNPQNVTSYAPSRNLWIYTAWK